PPSSSTTPRPSTSRPTDLPFVCERKGTGAGVEAEAQHERGFVASTQSPSGISSRFLALLSAEKLAGKRVLDVGCGWGRLALLLAPEAGHVVGLDRDASLIREGRARIAEATLVNVELHEADVEREEYDRWAPDLVTAHLCASDAILERAGRALRP